MSGGLPAPELRQTRPGMAGSSLGRGASATSALVLPVHGSALPRTTRRSPIVVRRSVGSVETRRPLGVAFGKKVVAEGLQAITPRGSAFLDERLYDGEVASVDADIKVLFAELRRRGFLDNAIVVITADHGEEFWEHARLTARPDAARRERPRSASSSSRPATEGGQRLEEAVSLVDLAPTLVDLLWDPAPSTVRRPLARTTAGELIVDVSPRSTSTGPAPNDASDRRHHAARIQGRAQAEEPQARRRHRPTTRPSCSSTARVGAKPTTSPPTLAKRHPRTQPP